MSNEKIISAEDAEKIRIYRKNVKNYYTDRRLYAVQLRGEGHRNKDIAEKLNADPRQVSQWVRVYLERGIEALSNEGGGGRPFKLTFEEEEEVLKPFLTKLEQGQTIRISEVKRAYESLAGKSKSHSHIYTVLERHGWKRNNTQQSFISVKPHIEVPENKKEESSMLQTFAEIHDELKSAGKKFEFAERQLQEMKKKSEDLELENVTVKQENETVKQEISTLIEALRKRGFTNEEIQGMLNG